MSLSTLGFSALVTNQVTAIQAAARQALDFGIGSILRAVVESNSGIMLWLQGLVLQVLAMARAATSEGADLDSWVGDYGLTRLSGQAATGLVTFARFTVGQQAMIPVGTLLQTADGSAQFIVTADDLNGYWNAGLSGYVVPANTASIQVPVEALAVGVVGNIALGTLTVIRQGIPYIDTATNGAGFANGLDAETDADLRTRFIAYLNSLARATPAAIGYAILSVQSGLTYTLTENYSYAGSYQPGYFYVVVDDGTGSPGSTLLNNISAAIEQYRALCVGYGVFASVVTTANVQMSITAKAGYQAAAVKTAVDTAVTNYINSLALGETLFYTRLFAAAYGVDGVQDAYGVTLNDGTSDVTADARHVIKGGTVTVN